jgi:hypothetical protein
MRGTWETTDSGGGGGLGTVVLVILAAAVLGPAVAAAVAELLHLLVIVAVILAAVAGAGLAGLAALRVHRWRTGGPARVPLLAPPPWRPVQAPTVARQVTGRPPPAIEHHHVHFHGISAEDVAAVIAREGYLDGPESRL